VQDLAPDWQSHPLLRFRYRSEGAPNASLVLRGTTFDGSNDLWTALAALPPAGPTWQTAVVDLAAALKAANPHLTMHRLFLEVGLPSLSGAVLIDDFALYSRTSTGARFRWAEPPDPSGVRGYSWLLDARDDSLPPETLTGRDRQAEFIGLSPGHHCFHLRAWDGAGNWGPATHLPFDVLPPSP